MNRFDRVASILIMLQTRQWITAGEMAARFDVSLRTIYRDLGTLDQAGIPLCAEPGKGYSLAAGYRLPPVMLTTDEAATLLMAEKMMAKLSDHSAQDCFRSAFDKIRSVLPARDKAMIEHLDNSIEVYHTPSIADKECSNRFLTSIQQALTKKEVITIGYQAFHSDEAMQQRDIEPIGLCFYSMHWHLIAWCRLRNDYRDFRVDRIHSITTTGQPIEPHHHMSLKDYFMSLRYKGELNEVTVTVNHKTAVMMEPASQYYGFVASDTVGEHITMHFVTSEYMYLARWLMMYLDGMVAIEPFELRHCIDQLIGSKKF